MEENKVLDFKVVDGKFHLGVDPNKDGQKVVKMNLYLVEALQEAMNRGEKVDNAKLVDVKFEGTKLVVILDTDKDGERLLDITIDLAEAFDEIQSAVSKKSE